MSINDILSKQEFIAILQDGCPDCHYQPGKSETAYKIESDRIEMLCPQCGGHFIFRERKIV